MIEARKRWQLGELFVIKWVVQAKMERYTYSIKIELIADS